MFCYVIFSKSENKHTKRYLYQSMIDIKLGDTVLVNAKNSVKIALVESVFENFPNNIGQNKGEIKNVVTLNKERISDNMVKNFLLALIDEYKDGNICKEKWCTIMKHFVKENIFEMHNDLLLEMIINERLVKLFSCCKKLSEEKIDKELEFWKELKDIEYILRYGYSFWNKELRKQFGEELIDEIEYTDEYLKIELELERKIYKEIGDATGLGYCHKYWHTKKNILQKQYGINWESPEELNPRVNYD